MDPILWHVKNVISGENQELDKYFWYWMAYLVQYPMKKPGTIPILRSLPRCGNVSGSELFYATSELGAIQ